MKSRILWIAILTLASITACYIQAASEWEHFINSLFMTGIIPLMVAGGYFVINGGFFDAFAIGFKKMDILPGQLFKRKEEYGFEDPLDGSGSEEKKKRKKQTWAWIATVCFGVGIINTALSLLLSL
ncbi:DUF3899 domain-containing protein [Melghirimyces algeriensis]|uniref:DUF3899 domain-containing protein n=1 Tax=Melghirimyces algeriensis TaxID=910412 RepID=A0A521EHP9_9BACL|nr:DUF3899 domain-containing protein [Melghirimyces algeriensis]SMO82991.1 protein of unknown function [Melghirimyces algeriensis]